MTSEGKISDYRVCKGFIRDNGDTKATFERINEVTELKRVLLVLSYVVLS